MATSPTSEKPGVRRCYPLEGGDYDFVKAQVMRHYKTRRRPGKCAKCKHQGRLTWRMEEGRWTVTCTKCGHNFRGYGVLQDIRSGIGDFGKWVFPIIKNIGPVDLIEQLVAVQPMNGPVPDPPYQLDEVDFNPRRFYRVVGCETGRVYGPGNIQEVARRVGHAHQTPEEVDCPICRAVAEIASKYDADIREILVRNLQVNRPRPPDPAPGVRAMYLDFVYGAPGAAPYPGP